ncbi:MAG: hypothetical protein A3G32_09460 [Deltaproteobacteria bacterium RIFCSPLOWO2_12_FULL_40_28]|nr:MAG: hypothetical protein A3C45_07730 [Deltaproteobacteria bacterium RIFCSPHIGHO2_02_FULL_40_28]OGQ20510.1 MAG: hypothetical protein A3E27_02520 [Deltaproteobacteria bacterium RIFCSPHIGHO2_12_FULL_40_32]OGQ41161.1 MAG: hypothetical protein A3I69_07755 [Deltaproteobacteria bacterium RIFCSPLOWO2_02_FULL_40_36]OGQ55123.1 MAG: hypothetical protein A3G32_09460 [Deltaproteobacteria bacterium RIFCSPLOWO2_12_FULL_40_28]
MEESIFLKTKFLEDVFTYDGTQLASHWILKNSGLKGDAIVSFIGPARVNLSEMVDLEDVLSKKHIHSEKMLHWIVEHFDPNLERMILRQRLLMSLMCEILLNDFGAPLKRIGDDLYSGDKKLSVSIATVSPVSGLIHVGINIESRNTPVPTIGLNDLKIEPTEFAHKILKAYEKEIAGINWARCKVRSV